jgi:mono/diheme cytochrome c family protein
VCFVAGAGRAEQIDGRGLYLRQCAPCHGASGRGDGPDAALSVTPPPSLRAGPLEALPASELVRRVLDGRRAALEFDGPALRARAADTESVLAYIRRLAEVDWLAADTGQVLFVERCTPCHGAFGRPPAQLPPGVRTPRDLADPDFQRGTSEAEMVLAVRHGRAGMPALTPRLSEAQATQAAAFVRLLSPGYITYAQYCAQCHGDHGIGVGSFAESYRAPTVVFDRAYFARRDPEEIRRTVWHMLELHRPSMPHFRGTVSEAEARAIVQYLKALRPDQ